MNPMKDKEREFINIPYIGRNDIVHSIIISLHNNEKKNNSKKNKRSYILDKEILPELHDEEKAKILVESAKIVYNNSREKKE